MATAITLGPRASLQDVPSEIFAPGLLDGRVAVVSGGGTGLGRVSALELSALGARARDNWFGPWPPRAPTDESGKPLAEERRPER